MNTAQLPPLARVQSPESITRAEIAAIEHQLALIDSRNRVLSRITRWFDVVKLAQHVCEKFETLKPETQQELAVLFHAALKKTSAIGKELAATASQDVLAIADNHFELATSHRPADLAACIRYLDDRIQQWFVAEKAEPHCAALIAEAVREPSSVVS